MMLTGDIPPNQTIYIKNINEKVKKEDTCRIAEVSRVHLPSVSMIAASLSSFRRNGTSSNWKSRPAVKTYGRIVDIVALKTPKLRGQAWVVFSEVTAASNAVRQMQNFPFYDKPMRIQYAKSKSDCIAKAEGTYDKKKKQEEKVEKRKRTEETPQTGAANGPRADSNGGSAAASRQGKPSAEDVAEPNNILFIQNLPHETTSMMLEVLFKQYPGFREVRMIEAKPGIAFVEFDDDVQSSVAMQALQGFKITPQNPMAITYAKK